MLIGPTVKAIYGESAGYIAFGIAEKMKTVFPGSRNLRSEQRAFTLAEAMIAVAVVVVMFVSLYVGISFGFAVTRFDRENLRATQIMLERMEGIRLFTYTQVSDTSLNPTYFTNYFYPLAAGGQAQGTTYYGMMSVDNNITMNPSATYRTNLKKITVTLQWKTGNVQRTRRMSTYVGKHGAQNYIYND